jgi:hypothetical protein
MAKNGNRSRSVWLQKIPTALGVAILLVITVPAVALFLYVNNLPFPQISADTLGIRQFSNPFPANNSYRNPRSPSGTTTQPQNMHTESGQSTSLQRIQAASGCKTSPECSAWCKNNYTACRALFPAPGK